ncbi:MAG: citryl-CoA lyase [Rhodocyclales bacterium]|nr:citryl-CoA lyase [Rhodocyclales bacterium]
MTTPERTHGPEFLRSQAGSLKSRMGVCHPGDKAIFRGHDLHRDLRHMDWIELYVFGITGRRFSAKELELLHALWVYTSYPDARLWNNRVAALAGSARSSATLGLAGALATSEAVIYGGYPFIRAIDFLRQARMRVSRGESLAEVVRQELQERRIYGYGRPINSKDERLPWLLELAGDLELDRGPHLKLAQEVETILSSRRQALRMNYAALAAALAADLGMSPREFHLFVFPAFLAGMPPCLVEAAQRPEGGLFPLSCADLSYEGPAPRAWPGAGKRQ